jgi:hypothetical protein
MNIQIRSHTQATDDKTTTVGTNQNKAARCTPPSTATSNERTGRSCQRTTHHTKPLHHRWHKSEQGSKVHPSPATSNDPPLSPVVNAPRAQETTLFGVWTPTTPSKPRQPQARRSRAADRSKGGRVRTFCRSAWSKEQRLGSGERPKAPETDAAAGRAGDAMLCGGDRRLR